MLIWDNETYYYLSFTALEAHKKFLQIVGKYFNRGFRIFLGKDKQAFF